MGRVQEQVCKDVDNQLSVVQRGPGEYYEPWRIISFERDTMEFMTPRELRELGRWLISEGKRIGREYTANGSLKGPNNADS